MTESLSEARARSEASGRTRSQTCGNCQHMSFAGYCNTKHYYDLGAKRYVYPGRYQEFVRNREACDNFQTRDR